MADFWSVVLGGVISAGAGYITTKTLYKEQRFDSAASDFQSTVFTKLNGVYPVPCQLDGEEMRKAKESRTYITGAAKKFRPHVKEKQAFDKALSQYERHCPNPIKDHITINAMSEEDHDMYRADLYKLEGCVETLLSFTEKKSVCLKIVEIFRCVKGIVS